MNKRGGAFPLQDIEADGLSVRKSGWYHDNIVPRVREGRFFKERES